MTSDVRAGDQVCALRAVTSMDGMIADFCRFEPAFLGCVATRIINEVCGTNRVVYDCTQSRRERSSGSEGKRRQSHRLGRLISLRNVD